MRRSRTRKKELVPCEGGRVLGMADSVFRKDQLFGVPRIWWTGLSATAK